MAQFPFSVDVKVRGYEIDTWGHVNNAVYLNWLEHARWELAAAGGFSAWTGDILPVIRHVELNFQHETLLGDMLRVTLWPRRVGTTSFTLGAGIRIIGATDPARVGLTALLATKTFVCTRRPGGKTEVPAPWRAMFPAQDPGPEYP